MSHENADRDELVELLDVLIDFVAELARAAGVPMPCLDRCPHDGFCTREQGHTEQHIAEGQGHEVCVWYTA